MPYTGIIIEESLRDKAILKKLPVVSIQIETVTQDHQTPWLKQWTLHKVEILEVDADNIANLLAKKLEKKHEWYADFKNESLHYIIFRNKVFKINRKNKEEYDKAQKYGISLGIPDYQVNFTQDLLTQI